MRLNKQLLTSIVFFFFIIFSSEIIAASGSVTVGFAGTHSSRGAFVDITANQDLSVTGFDLNLAVGAVTVDIYSKVGATTVSDTTNSASWTLYQTVNVTGNGQGIATNVAINPFPITSGQTVAFFTVTDLDGKMYNGNNGGDTTSATNSALTILSAFEAHGIFSNAYTGWPWQGTVFYNTGGAVTPATIPTLSQWALLLLIISLGFISYRVSYQRTK